MAKVSQEQALINEFEAEALESFVSQLSKVTDPRRKQGQRYSLATILVTMLVASICNANSAEAFAIFASEHEEEFAEFLDMPHGAPTQDVYLSVLANICIKEFGNLHNGLTAHIRSKMPGVLDDKHLAIDGKTSRRSFDTASGKLSAHTLHVWSKASGIVIAQSDCDRKTNEIKLIPELLKALNLKGCTVTIDAMGTQTQIVEQIVQQEGDYLIGLKSNQPTLFEDAQETFKAIEATIDRSDPSQYFESNDKGHGRIENRKVYLCRDLTRFRTLHKWKGLACIAVVVRSRTQLLSQKTTTETQYYIGSHTSASAKELGTLIRDHWSVENSCHWILDVAFGEDQARNRAKNSAQNFATLRLLALAALKSDTTSKLSIVGRRVKASCNLKYALSLIDINKN